MPSRALAAAAALALLLLPSCKRTASDAPVLRTPEERFSYGIGAKLGGDLRKSGHKLDRELVLRGLADGLEGAVALSDTELVSALQAGLEGERADSEALRAERAKIAAEQGRIFLAKNRARPGVVALDDGLQYEVLQAGTGPVPTLEDFVACNYRGSLLDGTVFEDTATLGRPRKFAVSAVVKGFEEALTRMPVGSRWKVYIPPELGYGAGKPGVKIPPNSTLIFEIELVSIEPAPSH